MNEQTHGGLTNRLGLYFGLAGLWIVLAFILNPVDAITQTTIGKLCTAAIGPFFGKITTPETWKPSLYSEFIGFLNPGTVIGLIVGYKDIENAQQLHRALLPGLLLLGPVVLIVLVPQGVWLSLPLGSFILVTLPYSLIAGALGWMYKQKKFSALTNGLTGRRLG